jgi:hypothetical protein
VRAEALEQVVEDVHALELHLEQVLGHARHELGSELADCGRRHRTGDLEDHRLEADGADVALLLLAGEHLLHQLHHDVLHLLLVHLAHERREALDGEALHIGALVVQQLEHALADLALAVRVRLERLLGELSEQVGRRHVAEVLVPARRTRASS